MPLENSRAQEPSELHRRLQVALGRDYELGAPIGRGGFAEVFVAWDRRLRREVAVKTIRLELLSAPGMLERFRRETEALGRLRHPNIVPVYSVGEGEGVAYFIMPRIRGESLAEAMQREARWSFVEVVRVLREAAGALAEAHRQGIVHRDIKPENIMVDGPERRVTVMDFGIAKSLEDTAAGGGLTGTGILVGTPQYMSPEQAMGESPVDHLSDQYSLAVVGYRLLTGQLPFDSDSMRSVLYQQAAGAMTPITALRPDIPAPLARILERALDRERTRRFPSMDEFADALRGIASEIAGEFRVGRSVPPIGERWTAARLVLATRGRMHATAAACGLLVFVLAYPHAESGYARRFAGARAQAEFVAQAALRKAGAPSDALARRDFFWDERLYHFLQRALPAESLARRLETDADVWRWRQVSYSAKERSVWWASVAQHLKPVSASNPFTLSPTQIPDGGDSVAASVERRVLSEKGWRPEQLVFGGRSVYSGDLNTTRTAKYRVPSRAVVSGSDTAHYDVRISTIGDRVETYSEAMSAPRDYSTGLRRNQRQFAGALSIAAMAVLFLTAVAIGVRRSARDRLQWRLAAAVGGTVLFGLLFTFVLPLTPQHSIPEFLFEGTSRLMLAVNWIVSSAAELFGLGASAACFMLVAESVMNEQRPDIAAGLDDLTHGRLRFPELIPAALAGYGTGLAVLGTLFVAAAGMHAALGVPLPARLNVAWPFEIQLPILGVVHVTALALWTCTLGYLFHALAAGIRVPAAPWVASIATGVLFGLYRLISGSSPELRVLLEGIAFVPVTWCLYSHGFIAAFIAATLILGVPVAADLIWAGGDLFLGPGLLGAVFLLLPGVAALSTYRLQRRRSS